MLSESAELAAPGIAFLTPLTFVNSAGYLSTSTW